MNKNDKSYDAMMSDAQYRKGLSIAFFNATNNSVDLIKSLSGAFADEDDLKTKIVALRDWFLDEHAKYHAQVIMNIGKPYSIVETIKKLETATNIDELKNIWLSLSADERDDTEILANKDRIKSELELSVVEKPKKVAKKTTKVAKKTTKKK